MSEKKKFTKQLNSEPYSYLKVTFHQGYRRFLPMHTHTFWEIFITINGSYNHDLNGKREITHKGDAYLIRPNDKHRIAQNESESNCLFLTIKTENMKAACSAFSSNLYSLFLEKDIVKCNLDEHQIRKITDLCYFIQKGLSNETPSSDIELPSSLLLFNALSWIIEQNYSFDEEKPEWLLDLLKQIENPINRGWHVSDIMEHANYSHSHVSRFFQKYLGCSVMDYLSEIKMKNAKNLILYSDMSVYEISRTLGYKSSTNFSAVFKSEFGLSPAQFRKISKDKKKNDLTEKKDLQ